MLPVWRVSNRAIEAKFHASPPASIQPCFSATYCRPRDNALADGEDRVGRAKGLAHAHVSRAARGIERSPSGARPDLSPRLSADGMAADCTGRHMVWSQLVFARPLTRCSYRSNAVTDDSTLAVDNVP